MFSNIYVILQCKAVLEPIDLSKELRLSDLETIFWSIQTSIAQDTASNPVDNLRDYILPEIPKNTTNDLLEKKIVSTSVRMRIVRTHKISPNLKLIFRCWILSIC